MNLSEILPLAVLDAISVSTLVIPILFLLVPDRILFVNIYLYLALLAAGYLAVGVLLLNTLSSARDGIRSVLESAAGDAVLTGFGIVLILFALWHGLRNGKDDGPGWLGRLRDAVVGPSATVRTVAVVALVAVLLEVATMFPYMLAINTLSRSGESGATLVAVLALYCLVMVAPAAVLTAGRLVLGKTLTPTLTRINDWIRRSEREDTAWLIAIVGVVILSRTDVFDRVLAMS